MTREEWLESLQVGDEVAYKTRWNGYTITTIARITPTRIIKTACKRDFKKGTWRQSKWEWVDLEPVTEEIRDNIRKANLVGTLKGINFGTLPLTKLERINEILMEETP